MKQISITTSTFIKFLAISFGVWFLFSIRQILAIIFFALIMSSAIDNSIDKLVSKKVPRFLSVAMIFVMIFTIIGVIVIAVAEPLRTQGQELIKNFPHYHDAFIKSLEPIIGNINYLSSDDNFFSSGLQYTTDNIFSALSGIFGGLSSMILMIVLTFYMSIETQALKKIVTFASPTKYHQFLCNLFDKIQNKIGDWIRGQLFLSLIVGVIVYFGLTLFGVKYALLLALIAGLGEFIPYIGAMTASLLGIFVAFSMDPILGIFVGIFYAILQMIENHILVPKVMQKAVGLNPIIIICSIITGIKIGGVMGALLAIPTATAITVIIEELRNYKDL